MTARRPIEDHRGQPTSRPARRPERAGASHRWTRRTAVRCQPPTHRPAPGGPIRRRGNRPRIAARQIVTFSPAIDRQLLQRDPPQAIRRGTGSISRTSPHHSKALVRSGGRHRSSQTGLADPRLTRDDHQPAPPRARLIKKIDDASPLPITGHNRFVRHRNDRISHPKDPNPQPTRSRQLSRDQQAWLAVSGHVGVDRSNHTRLLERRQFSRPDELSTPQGPAHFRAQNSYRRTRRPAR